MMGLSVAWGWLWPVLVIWLLVGLVSTAGLVWLAWSESRDEERRLRTRPFTADDWDELSEN